MKGWELSSFRPFYYLWQYWPRQRTDMIFKGGDCIPTIYGYVRVSSKDQNEARQIIAMREAGVGEKNIYLDKQSGKDFDRPQYKYLINKLKANDVLIIKSIDRLGRNYDEIKEQWRLITREKKTDIVVIDMPLLNTGKGRDLTGTLIADIVLELLSYVAQTERDYIKQRQAEGIAAAKARGVRFGGRPKNRPVQLKECVRMWQNGEISAREAGRRLGVAHDTFIKWASEQAETKKGVYCLDKVKRN